MTSMFVKIFAGLVLSTIFLQPAFASSNRQAPASNIENYPIPKPLEVGKTFLDISLYDDLACGGDQELKGGFVPLAIDIGLALIGSLLEGRQNGLMATYSGSKSAVINKAENPDKSLQCIKVERKEKAEKGSKDKVLSTLELLVEDLEDFKEASRLVVKKLDILEPGPSKSKRRAKTRLNYAVTVGFVMVDKSGKERTFSRNLPLIENVPLTGNFEKEKTKVVEINPEDKDKVIASSVFPKLPNSMVTTITVSITETDSKFSKAEKISDFFENNMSIIDTALGEVFD